MGSYAVCSVIALHSDDLMSVRGHMTPASLIQQYMVGPMKKKPNKLNLQWETGLPTEEKSLSAGPPETLHPVVGAECLFLDQRLLDQAAAGPQRPV